MSASNQACLVAKVFHFDVKDHVAFDNNWNPCGTFPLSSRVTNATLMFFISLVMVSAQRVEPERLSIDRASSTNFGKGRLYLWVFFKYLTLHCFTSEIITSLFLRHKTPTN